MIMTDLQQQKINRILSVYFKDGESEVFESIFNDRIDFDTFIKTLQKHGNEEIVFQGLRPIYFTLPTGKTKYIAPADTGVINILRHHPFSVIAQIFTPSKQDLQNELRNQRNKLEESVKISLSLDYSDIMCGEDVLLDVNFFETFIGYKKSKKWVLSMLHSLSDETLYKLLDVLCEDGGFIPKSY